MGLPFLVFLHPKINTFRPEGGDMSDIWDQIEQKYKLHMMLRLLLENTSSALFAALGRMSVQLCNNKTTKCNHSIGVKNVPFCTMFTLKPGWVALQSQEKRAKVEHQGIKKKNVKKNQWSSWCFSNPAACGHLCSVSLQEAEPPNSAVKVEDGETKLHKQSKSVL